MEYERRTRGDFNYFDPGPVDRFQLLLQHTQSIQESTAILRKQIKNVDARFEGFELYTLRHTCLTEWAPHMDPWALAYLAGHRDMNITKRYVHLKSRQSEKRCSGHEWRGVGILLGNTEPQNTEFSPNSIGVATRVATRIQLERMPDSERSHSAAQRPVSAAACNYEWMGAGQCAV